MKLGARFEWERALSTAFQMQALRRYDAASLNPDAWLADTRNLSRHLAGHRRECQAPDLPYYQASLSLSTSPSFI